MTFKPGIWQPIAVVASGINLLAVGYAAGMTEPLHASVHAVLALAFAGWAQRLGRRSPPSGEREDRLDRVEDELSALRQELSEAQERLDFTERLLAQRPERRVGPEQ
jgi:hypothetical protein